MEWGALPHTILLFATETFLTQCSIYLESVTKNHDNEWSPTEVTTIWRVYLYYPDARGRAVVCWMRPGRRGHYDWDQGRCRGRGGGAGVSASAIVPWSRNYIHHNNHHNWDNNAPGAASVWISLASRHPWPAASLLSIFNISPIM